MMRLYLTRGVIISYNMAYDRVALITGWPNSYVNIRRGMFANNHCVSVQRCAVFVKRVGAL